MCGTSFLLLNTTPVFLYISERLGHQESYIKMYGYSNLTKMSYFILAKLAKLAKLQNGRETGKSMLNNLRACHNYSSNLELWEF